MLKKEWIKNGPGDEDPPIDPPQLDEDPPIDPPQQDGEGN